MPNYEKMRPGVYDAFRALPRGSARAELKQFKEGYRQGLAESGADDVKPDESRRSYREAREKYLREHDPGFFDRVEHEERMEQKEIEAFLNEEVLVFLDSKPRAVDFAIDFLQRTGRLSETRRALLVGEPGDTDSGQMYFLRQALDRNGPNRLSIEEMRRLLDISLGLSDVSDNALKHAVEKIILERNEKDLSAFFSTGIDEVIAFAVFQHPTTGGIVSPGHPSSHFDKMRGISAAVFDWKPGSYGHDMPGKSLKERIEAGKEWRTGVERVLVAAHEVQRLEAEFQRAMKDQEAYTERQKQEALEKHNQYRGEVSDIVEKIPSPLKRLGAEIASREHVPEETLYVLEDYFVNGSLDTRVGHVLGVRANRVRERLEIAKRVLDTVRSFELAGEAFAKAVHATKKADGVEGFLQIVDRATSELKMPELRFISNLRPSVEALNEQIALIEKLPYALETKDALLKRLPSDDRDLAHSISTPTVSWRDVQEGFLREWHSNNGGNQMLEMMRLDIESIAKTCLDTPDVSMVFRIHQLLPSLERGRREVRGRIIDMQNADLAITSQSTNDIERVAKALRDKENEPVGFLAALAGGKQKKEQEIAALKERLDKLIAENKEIHERLNRYERVLPVLESVRLDV
jgi:hypothetical protein